MSPRKYLVSGHPIRALLVLGGLVLIGWALLHFEIDRAVVAGVLVLVGLATKAVALMAGLLVAIPLIGPVLVQVLTLPMVLAINGVAYVVTFIAFRRGVTMDAFRARMIAWGVLVGFILGVMVGRSLH